MFQVEDFNYIAVDDDGTCDINVFAEKPDFYENKIWRTDKGRASYDIGRRSDIKLHSLNRLKPGDLWERVEKHQTGFSTVKPDIYNIWMDYWWKRIQSNEENKPPKYPDYIMEAARQQRGLSSDCTDKDQDIRNMSQDAIWEAFCKWNGFIGFSEFLHRAHVSIFTQESSS